MLRKNECVLFLFSSLYRTAYVFISKNSIIVLRKGDDMRKKMLKESFVKKSNYETFIQKVSQNNKLYVWESITTKTPLSHYCIKHHKEIIDSQLKIQYLLENLDKNNFYLHTACGYLDLETVQYLLRKGMDPNRKDKDDFLPFHAALVGYRFISRYEEQSYIEKQKEIGKSLFKLLLQSGGEFGISHISPSDKKNTVIEYLKETILQPEVFSIIEKHVPLFTEEQKRSWNSIRMYTLL